jgi:arsenate reductase (glutaredoxin)
LRRFSQRFGALKLLDTESSAYSAGGLAYLRMSDAEAFERLLAEPRLLRLPLVRAGSQLSVGLDEESWTRWLQEAG